MTFTLKIKVTDRIPAWLIGQDIKLRQDPDDGPCIEWTDPTTEDVAGAILNPHAGCHDSLVASVCALRATDDVIFVQICRELGSKFRTGYFSFGTELRRMQAELLTMQWVTLDHEVMPVPAHHVKYLQKYCGDALQPSVANVEQWRIDSKIGTYVLGLNHNVGGLSVTKKIWAHMAARYADRNINTGAAVVDVSIETALAATWDVWARNIPEVWVSENRVVVFRSIDPIDLIEYLKHLNSNAESGARRLAHQIGILFGREPDPAVFDLYYYQT